MSSRHGKRKNLRKSQVANSVCFAEVLEPRLLMANFFTVSTLADTGAGSLRTAITSANADGGTDIITFSSGLTGTINLASALPNINSNTTIDGSSANLATVNGHGHGSVFTVNQGITATIEDLTITGGTGTSLNGSTYGGGIHNEGNLTVTSSTISGNTTTGSFGAGAGIYSSQFAGVLTVIDSTISGNTSSYFGGGLTQNYGTTTVTNSTITGNFAVVGAAFLGRGVESFIDSTISGNSATFTGGVYLREGTLGTFSCTVDGTILAANAGGDFANHSNHAATGSFDLIGDGTDSGVFTSSLRGTTASPLNPLLGALANNGGPTQTLALQIGSPALGTGGNFSGITTDQRGGPRPTGAIDIGAFQVLTVNTLGDPATLPTGTLSLRQAIIDANGFGGTQTINFISGLAGSIDLANVLPALNANITIDGPGANVLAVNGEGHGTVFTINQGITAEIENLTITGGKNTDSGGGIVNNGTLTISDSAISGNVSEAFGGGIYSDVPFVGANTGLTVIDSIISGNSGAAGSGGVSLNYGTLNVTNSTITGNSTGGPGGGFYGRGVVIFTDDTISGNSAVTTGGVYVGSGSGASGCTVDGTIIAANTGGDFFNRSTTAATGASDLIGDGSDNGVFANSLRGTKASPLNPVLGALANNGGPTQTQALLTGSPAIGNGASFDGITTDQRGAPRPSGAGIDIGAFQVQLLTVNTLTDPATPTAGILSLREAVADANSSGFAPTINFSTGLTGTINLASTLPVITSNTTIDGPGASALTVNGKGHGSVFSINSGVTAVIDNLTITGGKSTTNNGGGIYNQGNLTLSNSTISGNSVSGDGGGIYSSPGGALTVIDSTISGNSASEFSGGIGFNYGTLVVTNSTIADNSAPAGGGGFYGRGILTFTDDTISGNSASSTGGLYIGTTAGASSCTVDGTIIAANSGGDFKNLNGTAPTGSNDLIGDGSDGGVLANSLRGSKANPLNALLSPILENFGGSTPTLALQPGSPALGTGANFNNLNTDQRGFPRPTTSGIDMGADQGALFAGDTNFDETVNLTDLLTVLNNYGETGQGWTQGDFNFDGTVNLTDLLALLNHYGESANDTSIAAPAAAVVTYKAKSSPFASEPLAVNSAGSLTFSVSSANSDDADSEILQPDASVL